MNRLKELRVNSGITQAKLSTKTGLSRSMLYYLETGKRPMRLQHAEILAPYFGVTVDYIMGTDAIYYVRSFEDALSNLYDEAFDAMVVEATTNKANARSKKLYVVVGRLLSFHFSADDFDLIIAFLDNLSKGKDETRCE